MPALHRTAAAVLGGVLLATTATAALPAAAAPAAKAYANCTALNKVYPHGVAVSSRSKDKTTGKPVTGFTVSKAVYQLNDGAPNKDLDRDNDGIACEKK
jgi:hypothetical protein